MRRSIIAATTGFLIGIGPAKCQERQGAPPQVAETAFIGTLAVACDERAADWGDWAIQRAAADVQANQPMEGTGLFKYPEEIYFHRSLGEVAMAASAGKRLHDRFGKAACDKILDPQMLAKLDNMRARQPNFPDKRLLPADGVTKGITMELLDASFLSEASTLAQACKLRPAAWGEDADEVIVAAILTEADKKKDEKPDAMGTVMNYGQGAKQMAPLVANLEYTHAKSLSCVWVKGSPEIRRLDAMVAEWRKVGAGTKADRWSGLGGIE